MVKHLLTKEKIRVRFLLQFCHFNHIMSYIYRYLKHYYFFLAVFILEMTAGEESEYVEEDSPSNSSEGQESFSGNSVLHPGSSQAQQGSNTRKA